MQFQTSLEEIIGSKAKIKILKYLFGNQASMSENELARIVKVSTMTINRLMKELREVNFVSMERVGNANVWSVNKESYAYAVLSKIMDDISRIPVPLDHLKVTISRNMPRTLARRVVLYGSVSRGESRANSDIDLFIVVKSEKEVEKIQPYLDKLSNACLSLYGNRLSPYVLTEIQSRKRKTLAVFKEINKGIQIV